MLILAAAVQISIVLEYIDGGSLGDVLQKVKKIPENILSRITFQVLQGLVYLHKQVHTVRVGLFLCLMPLLLFSGYMFVFSSLGEGMCDSLRCRP
jgi:hypothetical protein